jgi:hypothetical protein
MQAHTPIQQVHSRWPRRARVHRLAECAANAADSFGTGRLQPRQLTVRLRNSVAGVGLLSLVVEVVAAVP